MLKFKNQTFGSWYIVHYIGKSTFHPIYYDYYAYNYYISRYYVTSYGVLFYGKRYWLDISDLLYFTLIVWHEESPKYLEELYIYV